MTSLFEPIAPVARRTHDPEMGHLRLGVIALVAVPAVGHADGGAPYREPQRAMRDSFTFWGWSDDGRRFAYETYSSSGGEPTDCSETAVLIVHDAARDRIFPDGTLRVASGAADGKGHCRTPDVQAALARRRDAHLRRHHVTVHGVEARRLEPDPAGRWTVALCPAHTASVQLEARDEDREDVQQDPTRMGASYRLLITLDGAPPREIMTGPRAGALHPELADAIVFADPAQRFAALCVPVTYAVPHGSWTRWDCHGLSLAPRPGGSLPGPACP
jgi:hypothetical protein